MTRKKWVAMHMPSGGYQAKAFNKYRHAKKYVTQRNCKICQKLYRDGLESKIGSMCAAEWSIDKHDSWDTDVIVRR